MVSLWDANALKQLRVNDFAWKSNFLKSKYLSGIVATGLKDNVARAHAEVSQHYPVITLANRSELRD